MTLQEIRDAFPGYHVNISLWPTGGQIELRGCEECGTVDFHLFSENWREGVVPYFDGEVRSLANAVKRLQAVIAKEN